MSRSLETHARVVGALHVALGVLFALGVAALGALALLAAGSQDGLAVPAGITAAMVLTPLSILAALHLAAGIGFLRFARWSRPLVFVLSLVALLNVPLGTAVGGYSLWVLHRTRGW